MTEPSQLEGPGTVTGTRVVPHGHRVLPAKFTVPDVPALTRQRVSDALLPVPPCRLVLLTAPAGSGKTTALANLATATPAVTTWFRAEHTEADVGALLAHLEHAIRQVAPRLDDQPWHDVATAATSLAAVADQAPTLLLLDDLHELIESPAEAALEQLIGHLPPWLAIVAASRHRPGFNLDQLRVRGLAIDVPSDLLRWRHWEVEQLFRDFYREPLRPEDAARLTQRTEGWAAGLQLFHLASRRLPMPRRRELIDELHTRPGLVRDYLTRNVLANLPGRLHRFLVDTCVLGRLDAALCDRLREADDSAACLADLEQRRLFTLPASDGRGYRYHEVLRSYLEVSLLERDGADATRARFRRAGALLDEAGDSAEALHAFARAEAWEDVQRLLGANGAALSGSGRYLWLGRLPAALMASDPWLQLAEARALRGEGQLEASVHAYADAQDAFGGAPAAAICRDERTALLPWVEVRERPPRTATDLLRHALRHDPHQMARSAATAGDAAHRAVAVVASLLAGDIAEAQRHLRAATLPAADDALLEPVTRLLGALLALAAGAPPEPSGLYRTAEVVEQLGIPWLARLARHLGDVQRGIPDDEVDALLEISEVHGDHWGRPLFALAAGIATVARGTPRRDWLVGAAEGFHELDAPVLEVWAQLWAILGTADEHDPEPVRALARQVGVPGAVTMLNLLEARRRGDAAGAVAASTALRTLGWGIDLAGIGPRPAAEPATPAGPRAVVGGAAGSPSPEVADATPRSDRHELRCFGSFRLVHDGRVIDPLELKPQCRQLLGRLALRATEPVSREQLIDDLWPDGGVTAPGRKLQVLISTLRRHLEPDATAGDWQLLLRRGEAYVLRTVATSDVQRFDGAVSDARRAQQQGDTDAHLRGLRLAYECYAGDLLPELGAPDWLVVERDRYRTTFARVTDALASAHLASDRVNAAITVAQDGLRVARYHSRLWERLEEAYARSGDRAAAARTADEHAGVLAELGQRPR